MNLLTLAEKTKVYRLEANHERQFESKASSATLVTWSDKKFSCSFSK
jgi:hypothetical protein